MPERGVEEVLQLGEVNNLLEAVVRLLPGHPVQARSKVDVFPAGQIRGKPTGDLDQRRHALVDAHLSLIGKKYPGDDLQQRGFPLPVAPDHADRFSLPYVEGDIAKRPEAVAHGAAGTFEDELAQAHVLSGSRE